MNPTNHTSLVPRAADLALKNWATSGHLNLQTGGYAKPYI